MTDQAPVSLDSARLQIARLVLDDFADLKRAMLTAARVSATTLGVTRVGIWSLADDRGSLRLCAQHDLRQPDEQANGEVTLPLSKWERYLAAVSSGRVVATADALSDPRTSQLAEAYLIPHGVTSMMDAPLFLRGEVWGVVCHEHTGLPRVWSEREVAFAASVADMLSTMLEQAMRLAIEARLRQTEAELAQLRRNEAVVRTAAAIGHDINTLLQAISGRAELSVHQGESEQSEALLGIVGDCQRAARIVGQLRELSAPARAVGLEADLSFVIEDTRATLDALLAPSHSLELELAPEARVPASRADLERILLNLVVNAKEAMAEGGLVSVSTRRSASNVSLEVRDQGSGIPPERAEHIFEPYFTTKDGRNTGLGLFAVATIARRTQGVVALDSAPGKGTRVTITWPAS
ncbi:MAG TPA: HAMP domain-containing sensor histidine kinase [Polyangiaceae bacterium]|nr:HAMP domain-containing sensor histidine kinase [Polyangiaceae bacterium]